MTLSHSEKSWRIAIFILVVLASAFFAFSLLPLISQASHPIPPQALCEGPKGTNQRYECTGERPGTSFQAFDISSNAAQCITACNAAEGHPLVYSVTTGRTTSNQWYCYGALEEGKTCSISVVTNGKLQNVTLDVKTGVQPVNAGAGDVKADGQVTPETAEAEGRKKCGQFLDVGCWISRLISEVIKLATGILDILIAPIAGAVKLLAGAVARLMGAAIAYLSGITVSPAISTTPEFVTTGWNFTRSLANNFFILILAFIGLATILRLQAYQLQKTLPLLIIVALLVNFSGVLVGFFADIGALITNFFIQATAKTAWDNFGATFTKMSFWGGNPAASFATHIAEIIFYLIATLIYFVIILLFALRAVILWTLTMTAPLAFVAYILPATRMLWNQWWKNLIQWSLIGIPISFFLFLASKVLGGGAEPALQLSPLLGAAPPAIASLAAPFTTFVLLFTGITMSMAMAPAAAQGAIKLGRSMPGRIAQTKLGAKALAGTATGTQKFLAGQGSLHEGLKKIPGVGKGLSTGLRWATAPANRLAGSKLIEYAASKRKWQPPKNWDQMSTFEQEAYINAQGLGNEDRVQAGAKMGKNLKYTSAAFKTKLLGARDGIAQNPNRQGEIGAINDIFPESVTEKVLVDMAISTAVNKEKARTDAEEKIGRVKASIKQELSDEQITIEAGLKLGIDPNNITVEQKNKFLNDLSAAKIYAQGLKPQDIPNVINPKTLAFRLAMRDSNPASLQRLQDNFDHETLQDMFQGTGGLDAVMATPDQFDKFAQRNPRMARALFTNPALIALGGEARGKMRDVRGQPTTRYNDYERRLRVHNLIKDEDKELENKLSQVYEAFQNRYINQENMRKLESTIREEQRVPGGGDINKIREGQEGIEEINSVIKEIDSTLQKFGEEVITEPNPKKKEKMQELWQLLSEGGDSTPPRQRGRPDQTSGGPGGGSQPPRRNPPSGSRPSTPGESAMSNAIDDFFGVGRQQRQRPQRKR